MAAPHLLFFCLVLSFVNNSLSMFTLNKNDPAPFYSSVYPYFYLYNDQNTFQLPLDDDCVDDLIYVFQLSFSPFYQRSSKGSNFCECYSELGDMTGRPNLLAILPFTKTPTQLLTVPRSIPIATFFLLLDIYRDINNNILIFKYFL